MINLPGKPLGSTIEVQNDFNRVELSWKNPRGGFGRYGTILFMLAWMGGWAVGEVAALNQVLKDGGGAFLIFWLVAWTVGGIFVASTIFKMARPSRPEKLTLDTLYLSYEPGTERIWTQGKQQNPIELLRSKKPCKAAKVEIGNIRIDRVGERQRLSFDYGARRVEVGQYLEEPEREWLLAILKSWKSA